MMRDRQDKRKAGFIPQPVPPQGGTGPLKPEKGFGDLIPEMLCISRDGIPPHGWKSQRNGAWGFTTMEYSVLILVLVLALLAVQTTLRRAISDKWKQSVDDVFGPRQYDPGVTTVTGN